MFHTFVTLLHVTRVLADLTPVDSRNWAAVACLVSRHLPNLMHHGDSVKMGQGFDADEQV